MAMNIVFTILQARNGKPDYGYSNYGYSDYGEAATTNTYLTNIYLTNTYCTKKKSCKIDYKTIHYFQYIYSIFIDITRITLLLAC